MNEPPFMIDGTRVVEYATIDVARAPQRFSFVVGGVTTDLSVVAGALVAQDLVDGGAFLLVCNRRWETVAVAHHPTVESARAEGHAALEGAGASWTRFRDLTPDETREVETTRAFLRELADDFPGGQ